MERDDPAYKGQADYTPLLLRLYDPLVLGPIARFVWRVPTSELPKGYREHIREPHLDVGPGTGYFIAPSGLPDGSRRRILAAHPNVLRHALPRLQLLDVTEAQPHGAQTAPI